MLLIYSQKITPRLSFIVKLIFEELLGINTEITTSQETFNDAQGACLNYTDNNELPGIQITPSDILFEEKVPTKSVGKAEPWYGLPTLKFANQREFDLIGMSFFLVSRYEEYGDFVADDHGRFPATESCLVKHDLLRKPLVNQWALRLLDILKEKYPDIQSRPRTFGYLSTIDIDQAWKFKNKGVVRNIGGLIRDVFKSNWHEVSQRLKVLSGLEKDPFFNFDYQDQIHQSNETGVIYFLQVGDRGEFDKNTSIEKRAFQKLIQRLDKTYVVGLHPSYQSNIEKAKLPAELQILENVVAHDIETSRQHYLIHSMPETYVQLEEAGLREDHTMGYSTHVGFRAGIAAPFNFFDLRRNEETKLRLVPFCLMDITPPHYLGLSQKMAEDLCADLIWEVKNVGGLFVSLWHNESLSEDGRWKGWRGMYEFVVKQVNSL
jgi:Family of unknown function (DUF7033)